MAILTFEVKGQTLTVKSSIERIVEKSIDYLNYDVKINEPEWEDCAIHLIITNEKNLSKDILYTKNADEDNYIPKDAILAPGFQVTIIGKKTEKTGETEEDIIIKQIPTNPIYIQVYPAGAINGEKITESDVPEDFVGRVYSQINNIDSALDKTNNNLSDSQAIIEKNKSDILDINNELNQLKEENSTHNTMIENQIKALSEAEEAHGVYNINTLIPFYAKLSYTAQGEEPTKIRNWVKAPTVKSYLFPYSKKNENENLYLFSEENTGELAFFSEYHSPDDEGSAPCLNFTIGADTKERNLYEFDKSTLVREVHIPDGTKYIYVLGVTGGTNNRLPSKLEINGYDYCKGVTENILNLGKIFSLIEEDYASALELLGGAE